MLAAMLLLLIASVFAIIACLFSTFGGIRLARTGSIREGIRFNAILSTIRTMGWGTYLIALLVLLAISIIFSIITGALAIIPFVGWVLDLIINPLLAVFTARFITRVYDIGAPLATATVPESSP
jgi:hypothetical protein